jgi:hypothetical protein
MANVATESSIPEVTWDDNVDAILRGDLTVAAAYVTPMGGTVVTSVAPCGLASRAAGTVGFSTSLGIGKKLEHIVRDPHVALAYHTREHGSATSASYVLVQGTASVDLTPSMKRLEQFIPQAEQFLGPVKRGRRWDRLLREYYYERVFVDIAVERVLVWDNLAAWGEPFVVGAPRSRLPVLGQAPPGNGTAPRVDCDRFARQLARLPHRLVGYRGADGFPIVVPVDLGGHDDAGLQLVSSAALPYGGRRAGLLAHAFRPQLLGLSTRTATGWLEVDGDRVCYAPHISKGFTAVANKTLLLSANGLLAKYGLRRARRYGAGEALRAAQSRRALG